MRYALWYTLDGHKFGFIVLRFRSDLADLIEQFPRRSCATLRKSRLKIGQRWPEDEMRES